MFLNKFIEDSRLPNWSGEKQQQAPRLFCEEPHGYFNLSLENQLNKYARAVSRGCVMRMLYGLLDCVAFNKQSINIALTPEI